MSNMSVSRIRVLPQATKLWSGDELSRKVLLKVLANIKVGSFTIRDGKDVFRLGRPGVAGEPRRRLLGTQEELPERCVEQSGGADALRQPGIERLRRHVALGVDEVGPGKRDAVERHLLGGDVMVENSELADHV